MSKLKMETIKKALKKIEVEEEIKMKVNPCYKSKFVCNDCELEQECFEADALRFQSVEKPESKVKTWQIVLFMLILILALIGESVINLIFK